MAVRHVYDSRVSQATNKPNGSATTFDISGSATSGPYVKVESAIDPITGTVIATNDIFSYDVFADSLFEEGWGVVDKTAHTITRNPTRNSSGTLSKIDFSGASATPVMNGTLNSAQAQSLYNAHRSFIRGLELQDGTTNVKLRCSAGACFIEGLDAVIESVAPAEITPTLANSTLYYVYAFVSSGVLAIECVTTVPTAFANPAGNARSKTGDTSRRFIGCVVTDSSGHILPQDNFDLGGGYTEAVYTVSDLLAAPYALLSNGTAATSSTAINLSSLVPPNVAVECQASFVASATGGQALGYNFNKTDAAINSQTFYGATNSFGSEWTGWLTISPATPQIFYKALADGTSPKIYFAVSGYRFRR